MPNSVALLLLMIDTDLPLKENYIYAIYTLQFYALVLHALTK